MVNGRLRMIFTAEEINRLTISRINGSMIRIIADVHGMKCCQVRRFINNIINVTGVAFQLMVIHGYNHGTFIKDMLLQEFSNVHIIEKHLDPHNQGVTHMSIAA